MERNREKRIETEMVEKGIVNFTCVSYIFSSNNKSIFIPILFSKGVLFPISIFDYVLHLFDLNIRKVIGGDGHLHQSQS